MPLTMSEELEVLIRNSELFMTHAVFAELDATRAELARTKDALANHLEVVCAFLSTMYCIMIDPLGEGVVNVEDTCKRLIEEATAQRERENVKEQQLSLSREVAEKLAEALQERHRASCPDCLERPDLGIYPGLCKSKEALALYAAHRPAVEQPYPVMDRTEDLQGVIDRVCAYSGQLMKDYLLLSERIAILVKERNVPVVEVPKSASSVEKL